MCLMFELQPEQAPLHELCNTEVIKDSLHWTIPWIFTNNPQVKALFEPFAHDFAEICLPHITEFPDHTNFSPQQVQYSLHLWLIDLLRPMQSPCTAEVKWMILMSRACHYVPPCLLMQCPVAPALNYSVDQLHTIEPLICLSTPHSCQGLCQHPHQHPPGLLLNQLPQCVQQPLWNHCIPVPSLI